MKILTDMLILPENPQNDFNILSPDLNNLKTDLFGEKFRRERMIEIFTKILGDIDDSTLMYLEKNTCWRALKGGEYLFKENDISDRLFILVSGRLQAVVKGCNTCNRLVGEIAPGETVGEMAFFTSEPRSASILAIRDSELLEFPQPVFQKLIQSYPQVVMSIVKLTINRLRNTIQSPFCKCKVTNIVVLPAKRGVDLSSTVSCFSKALSKNHSVMHLSTTTIANLMGIPTSIHANENAYSSLRLTSWLNEQEACHDYIIYQADDSPTKWTRQCIRQADLILIVARADQDPSPGELENIFFSKDANAISAKKYIVLLHDPKTVLPSETARWLKNRVVENHFHIRRDSKPDFDRLARFISGNSVGIVLGGGGARGLAHIGVLQALTEAGVPIDMIGGTSMGSVFASQYALLRNVPRMIEESRKMFLSFNPLSDYTLPLISLVRTRRLERLLTTYFGDTMIEDLWLNYFCVSSNLTTGKKVIHRTGPLWKAIRASVSIPGVAVPSIEDSNILVDGAVFDNLPGDVMRKFSEGKLIAVDVGGAERFSIDFKNYPSPWSLLMSRINPFRKGIKVPTISDIIMRTNFLSSIQGTEAVKRDADLYLQPPVGNFSTLNFKSYDQIIATAYEYTWQQLKKTPQPTWLCHMCNDNFQ